MLALIPTVSRAAMIQAARTVDKCIVIEHGYRANSPIDTNSQIEVSEFVVVVVPDVVLLGSPGLPVTRGGRILVEPVSSKSGGLYLQSVRRVLREIGLNVFLLHILFPRRARTRDDIPVISTGVHVITRASPTPGKSQYAHWLLEHAPQVIAVESIRESLPKSLAYVTNATVEEYQRDFFRIAGVPLESVRPLDHDAVRVERLIVATLRNGHSTGSEYDPRTYRRLRDALCVRETRIERHADLVSAVPCVAAMRQSAGVRRTNNFELVRDMLQDLDITYLEDDQPFADQEAALSRARVFIGIYGAGMTKMLFAERLSHVIEIVPFADRHRDVYRKLSYGLGLQYVRIVCPMDSAPSGSRDVNGITVPVEELRAILDSILVTHQ